MSSCDAWIQFVTPSDVRALKERIDPYVVALDAAMAKCPQVDAATRASWTTFSSSWRNYYKADDHFLTAGAEFNAGCEYESAVAGWQRTIGALACGVPGPSLPTPPPSSKAGENSTASTVRTVAIAAGITAVALTIRSLVR